MTLSHFSGLRQEGQVKLLWKTASETENKGFEILRQAEGENGFGKVGFIKGKGSTSQAQAYTFMDLTAPAGTVYYRLKQIDFDGTYSYSPIIALQGTAPLKPVLSLTPVPADEVVTLHYSDTSREVQYRLRDASGKLMAQGIFRGKTSLDTNRLSPGLYLVQVFDAAGQPVSETRKLIIRH